jgi:hypothetical protein
MRFSIATIAYVFALVAAALAAFGGWGIPLALMVVATYATPAYSKLGCLAIWLYVALLVWSHILFPAISTPSEYYWRSGCGRNLRMIAQALQMHVESQLSLPAAVQRDDAGAPLHSWRTQLLPFIEQRAAYEGLQFHEPWNSSANARITTTTSIDLFVCSSNSMTNGSPATNYFAIVGPQTAWPRNRGRQLKEITDGLEETILLIESAGRSVTWAEPRDLSFDEALALLTKSSSSAGHIGGQGEGYFYQSWSSTRRVINVAFANGEVKGLTVPMPRTLATALLTADSGDKVDFDELRRHWEPQLNYGKIVGLAAFVILAMWPARRRLQIRSRAPQLLSAPSDVEAAWPA